MSHFLNNLPKPFFILAPMDDVTDTVFRQIIAEIAAPDLFITEFVNVDGLQSPGRPNLLKKLKFSDKERPIIAQIWGKNSENFYKTTKDIIKMGFDGVDINMGCPEKSVIKNGCCIALVNNRELAAQIISQVKRAAGPNFSVSVKTRLGLKEIDYSWHEFLLNQKIDMLTIHGRTASQMSKVPADWETIAKVRQLRDKISPKTLVVGNGDVKNYTHGLELAKKHKLDAVMIGRGIFDDPFAFSPESPWKNWTKSQKIALYKNHVELFAKTWKNNERKVYTLNKFCKVYINGFDGAKELREQFMAAKDAKELLNLLSAHQPKS